jgi:hypothetical protein
MRVTKCSMYHSFIDRTVSGGKHYHFLDLFITLWPDLTVHQLDHHKVLLQVLLIVRRRNRQYGEDLRHKETHRRRAPEHCRVHSFLL